MDSEGGKMSSTESQSVSPRSLHVLIVGGSICGLFAGIIMKRLGYTVRILEHNPASVLPAYGSGIVSGLSVQEFFRDATHPINQSAQRAVSGRP
ncbi:uncharacterized protein LY89DRAFT_790709 [Mollisia scopiformis]|uniref:FAD-binding domain-containing protein n=1 Tax=Mollisia scopiformis TaxID=149040 RepID=A0A132B2B7_MOLSC|nr:uncharacterized protein LY89DRAFT_790709 [Mollisia scopiformis]KUJ06179.1 hypothetical protein LY89DRAFT_790709 [Mollisia scopiformis]